MALSKILLNTDRFQTSITSLGNLFKWWTTFSVKKCFVLSSLKLPCHSSQAFPHLLPLDTRQKRSHICLHFPSAESWDSNGSVPQPDWRNQKPLAAPHRICLWALPRCTEGPSKLWGPEVHRVLKARQQQSWMKWDNHLSWLAGDAVLDAPLKYVVPPFGCQGTLLTRICISIQLFVSLKNPWIYTYLLLNYFKEQEKKQTIYSFIYLLFDPGPKVIPKWSNHLTSELQ